MATTHDKPPPNPGPVELQHMDELVMREAQAKNRDDGTKTTTFRYQVLLEKPEMYVILWHLAPTEILPTHQHDAAPKAIYVYSAGVDDGVEIVTTANTFHAKARDVLFVPAGAAISFANSSQGHNASLLFFFPTGDKARTAFGWETTKPSGNGVKWIQENSKSWEDWRGHLAADEKPGKLAWKTLIDDTSMILGITRIEPGYHVDSHYHLQTQIILFDHGQGETHIANGEYRPVKQHSFIYPPSYSIHHTRNTSATEPLLEVYFFPSGPFSTIHYLFQDEQDRRAKPK